MSGGNQRPTEQKKGYQGRTHMSEKPKPGDDPKDKVVTDPGKDKPADKKPEAKPDVKETPQQQAEREKKEAEEKAKAEVAGLESQKGALQKDVEALRLEKRTLAVKPEAKPIPPANETPEEKEAREAAEAEAAGSQDEITKKIKAETEPLKQQLTAQQKAVEKEVITTISNDSKFTLISPSRDVENKNWNRLLVNYRPPANPTKEILSQALKAAYYATFGAEIEAEAEERGRAKGAAEAANAANADLGGGGTGAPKGETVQLTPEQKATAKKMGLSEDQYIKGMRKSGRL